MPFRRRAGLALFSAVAFLMAPALRAAYPERPLTLVVPFAPGGSSDILARALGRKLGALLGQPVIIDNHTGASGNVGAALVAKAKPDGYTLLLTTFNIHTTNHLFIKNMPFDGLRDFTPIAKMANVVTTLVVHTSVPAGDVRELVKYAKANPGKLAYASAGPGSVNHVAALLFEKAAGIQMLHVPYRGGAPAALDTAAGQTQVLFSATTQTLPHVQSNKLRLLAVTDSERSRLLPKVPTVGEAIPGYAFNVWYGLAGPAGMPQELVRRLNEETDKALNDPAIRSAMEAIGVELVRSAPVEFGRQIREEESRLSSLIRTLGVTPE